MERAIISQKRAPEFLDTIKWNEETVPMAIMLVVIGVDKKGKPESVLVGKRSGDKQHYPNMLALPTESFEALDPGYNYKMYDLIISNFRRSIEEELSGFNIQQFLPEDTIRLHGVVDDNTGFRLFVVSLQTSSEALERNIMNVLPTEWLREFSTPPSLLKFNDLIHSELTESSLSAIKIALEQKQREHEVFNKFAGLKDLNIYGDNYLLIQLIANYMWSENSETIEKLKRALAFRIVDGIQYEHNVDMFNYPPWADEYDINAEEIVNTFREGQSFEFEVISKMVHSKIWKDAFIQNFNKILEATILEKEIVIAKRERPHLPEIPLFENNETVKMFLDAHFGYFQNAYILLHALTGSVPAYLNKYFEEGGVDYALQNTIDTLAELLANGYIGYWYDALDIACSGIIESKSSPQIIYAAIDVFKTLIGVQFTDIELDLLWSTASKFIEEKVMKAFV